MSVSERVFDPSRMALAGAPSAAASPSRVRAAATSHSTLTYAPALDGIRALAVIAVVAYHLEVPLFDGGLLGVSVFFTLSGYLITSLLLQEFVQKGRIDLSAFWLRRARRLLPALLLMLTVVGIATAVAQPAKLGATARQIAWALLYVSNWSSIARGDDYFQRFTGPGPLDHLWSLAVEEQFYLVWPLVVFALLRLAARRQRRRLPLFVVTALLTAASTYCIARLYDPNALNNTRAYEGTDARAAALSVGALAALCFPLDRIRKVPSRLLGVLDATGIAALLGVAVFIVGVNEYSSFLYRGGELVLASCVATLVVSAAHPETPVARALSFPPLRWIGVRSYGIYLWHLPVVAFARPALLADRPAARVLCEFGVMALLAAVSFRWIEEPIRARQGVPRLTLAFRGALVASVATLALLASPMLVHSTLEPDAFAAEPDPAEVSAAPVAPTTPSPPPSPTPAEPVSTPLTACTELVHIGDSTSVGLISRGVLPKPEERMAGRYRAIGVDKFFPEISGARSMVEILKDQQNATQVAKTYRNRKYGGCWVLALGTNDPANTGGNVELLTARIDSMMAIVGNNPVLWTTTKTLLAKGPYQNANMERWNTAIKAACVRYPNMRLYDWANEVKDAWFTKDKIHFNDVGCKERAARIAQAVALAFPKDHPSPSGCMIQTPGK